MCVSVWVCISALYSETTINSRWMRLFHLIEARELWLYLYVILCVCVYAKSVVQSKQNLNGTWSICLHRYSTLSWLSELKIGIVRLFSTNRMPFYCHYVYMHTRTNTRNTFFADSIFITLVAIGLQTLSHRHSPSITLSQRSIWRWHHKLLTTAKVQTKYSMWFDPVALCIRNICGRENEVFVVVQLLSAAEGVHVYLSVL